jgi:hypothetical protein
MGRMVLDALTEVILGYLVFHALLIGGIGVVLLVAGWLVRRRTAAGPVVDRPLDSERLEERRPIDSQMPPPISPISDDETMVDGPEE